MANSIALAVNQQPLQSPCITTSPRAMIRQSDFITWATHVSANFREPWTPLIAALWR